MLYPYIPKMVIMCYSIYPDISRCHMLSFDFHIYISYEIKYLHDIPKKIPIEIAEALRLAKPLGALFRAMGMVEQVEDLIAF